MSKQNPLRLALFIDSSITQAKPDTVQNILVIVIFALFLIVPRNAAECKTGKMDQKPKYDIIGSPCLAYPSTGGIILSVMFRKTREALELGSGRWVAVVVAAIAFAVYLATLAPGLTHDNYGTDGGDLIAAARTLGVPHPPGYPTYTLLAWLFSHLPVGILAYRVNLLSAVSAAVAVAFLYLTSQLLQPPDENPVWIPAATSLVFAFSPLLWSQAVITEVYALHTLFASLLLWLLVRWRTGARDPLLWLAAFTLGLGLGNHLTIVFVAPAALVLLWSERQRWFRVRVLLPAVLAFILGLSIYVYLPLAAAQRPPVNWGNPQTWRGFLWTVTARQYQAFGFGLEPSSMPGRLGTWALLFGTQFAWWGLAIALFGLWGWWQRDRPFARFALVWTALVGTYAFFYNTGDSHVYLLPVFLLMALWWGEGVRRLLRLVQHRFPAWHRVALVAVLLLPLVSLGMHWQEAAPDDEWQVHTYIDQVLDTVAPGGLVVVRGDRPTFALWYGVYGEGKRPDIAVVNGPMLAFIWYREHVRYHYPNLTLNEPRGENPTIDDLVRDLVAANLADRQVYATDPKELWEEWFDFEKEGEAPIYHAYPKNAQEH